MGGLGEFGEAELAHIVFRDVFADELDVVVIARVGEEDALELGARLDAGALFEAARDLHDGGLDGDGARRAEPPM